MSIAFLLTSLVVVLIPGIGAIYTMTTGLSHGRRASVVAACGCTLGIVPHLVAAITGLAALLNASAQAFQVLKFAGVAYLLYMAWGTWRDDSPLVVEDRVPRTSALRIIGWGIVINLLNPKLTIFFFAFLPQFVPAGSPHALVTLVALSGVFMAMTFVVFVGYGSCAAGLRRYVVARPRVLRRLRRGFALAFVGLGAKLATSTR